MSDADEPDDAEEELPEAVIEEAERLSRLARETTVEAEREAYERERTAVVEEHGFVAWVREDDAGETLVLYPEEWTEDGTIVRERIDDTDRAVERSLSGPGDPEAWATVDEHNRDLADAVRAEHGDVHGDNADALAAFMSNHYAKTVEAATGEELREFLEEYFPRNAWPTDAQRRAVERSLELVFETADRRLPAIDRSEE